jgi:predicted glycoside hydrolase/deacetylase ChbG (UPF0249 family)
MDASRYLVVIADDYGIGPETSRAILELAMRGVVTGTVLLVGSPHAAEAVRCWRASGSALEMGWHPSLTLDRPLAPPDHVPSLVGPDGCMWPLRHFLLRLLLGRIRPREVEIELEAQLDRFISLVGHPPTVVNSHQHVSLFPPVGFILRSLLARRCPSLPYLRRVREPWSMLSRVRGARVKRTLLTVLGRREARQQERLGFPGAEWLAGVTDPPWVKDADFFSRWLTAIPGRDVELACHPGYLDRSLLGRDCREGDGLLQRRVDELHLLRQEAFVHACARAGFHRVSPSEWLAQRRPEVAHAA